MKPPVNGLWSSQQLSWLGALGFQVYTRASPITPTSLQVRGQKEKGRQTTAPAVAHPVTMPSQKAPLSAQQSAPGIIAQTPVRSHQPLSLASIQFPDRLQLAMLKACACDPSRPDIAQLMAQWPLDDLRANPNAKRLLWPQLRRLRRHAFSQ